MSVQNLQRYPSMGSMHSLASLGYMPPGHGYVPKKQKPEKPYGLAFTTVMNRTHRGPGRKYLYYALVCLCMSLLFALASGLYFGHRIVSRMIVLRTEVLGAFLLVIAIILFTIMANLLYKARVESNRWRMYIRFRPEGLNTAAAINYEYVPETQDSMKLQTGTFGLRALKEVPKPRAPKKKGKGKGGSKMSSPPGSYPQTPLQASSPAGTLTYQYPPRYAEAPPPAFHPVDPAPHYRPTYAGPPATRQQYYAMGELQAPPSGRVHIVGVPEGRTSESEF